MYRILLRRLQVQNHRIIKLDTFNAMLVVQLSRIALDNNRNRSHHCQLL
jgi:hypothetical protein